MGKNPFWLVDVLCEINWIHRDLVLVFLIDFPALHAAVLWLLGQWQAAFE